MILHAQPRRNNKKTFAINHENKTYFVSDAIKKVFCFHSAKNYVNENEIKYDIVQAQFYIPVLLSDASQDALKLVPDSPNSISALKQK